ncbi:MAG TPA: sensor domain-containing phosphodiesterase [Pseudomonas sp.]|nr:sensor domain-containing phosphodiesterase [Pseudomonas sp.]
MAEALEHRSWLLPDDAPVRRHRLRALSRLGKVSLSFVLIHLLVTLLFTVSGYRFKAAADDALLGTRLSAIVQALPVVIGDDYLGELLGDGPFDEPRYQAMLQRLDGYAKKAGVDSIYVLTQRGGHTLFVMDSANTAEIASGRYGQHLGHYDSAPPELDEVFAQRRSRVVEYSDQFGDFRSLFLPIRGPHGSQLVLGADVSLEAIKAERRACLLLFLGIGLTTFVLGLLVIASRELRISELAFEDPLTGLPNRTRFIMDVNRAIAAGHRPLSGLTVAIFDICDVKRINALYGYGDGNLLLQGVARRLAAVLGEGELLARLPSDGFALLLRCDQDICLARLARTLDKPFRLGGQHAVMVKARLGLARYPIHGRSVQDLLCYAEVALDAARHQAVSHVFYDPELEQRRLQSMALLDDFDQAIEAGELRVFLQPKARLSDGHIGAAEALVRWEHPRLGLIAPGVFLPIIEDNGRICALSLWLLRECMQLSRACDLRISVNLSVQDLESPTFPTQVQALLAQTGADAAQLCLEITESSAMRNPEQALVTLTQLRQLGFSLAIDDFGTGYSSLAYLSRLPVDELKIDRSFITQLHQPEQQEIVRAIIQLGLIMNLRLVAEGVEDRQVCTLLASFGCHEVQGYVIARPMPAHVFLTWLAVRAGHWTPDALADGARSTA